MPAALILTLDAAGDGCSAAVVAPDGRVLAVRERAGGRGSAAALPAMAEAVLLEAGVAPGALGCVAVTVGPGSFTGVRAALALAAGIGVATGVPVRGVSVGAAIRAALGDDDAWVVLDSRRGAVFLDRGGAVQSLPPGAVPPPPHPVALAGDAAHLFADRPEFRPAGHPAATPGGIARAAMRAGTAGADPFPVPLYVDGAAARPVPPARPLPA